MKKLGLVLAAAAMVAFAGGDAMAAKKRDKGNGAPSGHHFTLNLIGMSYQGQKQSHSGGSVIHVKLWGNTKIHLCQTDNGGEFSCPDGGKGDFHVFDSDGTDGDALFGLPDPGDDNGVTDSEYSVFVRGMGKKDTYADIAVCATDNDTATSFCDTGHTIEANEKRYVNVTRDLLYISEFVGNGGGGVVALFDELYEDYWWSYDNYGLRVAQLRFYWCATIINTDTGAVIGDECFAE